MRSAIHSYDLVVIGSGPAGEKGAAQAATDLFIQTCFNYPTLSETYKYATYDAMGRRQRQAKRLVGPPGFEPGTN